MIDVGADKASLFFEGGVVICVTGPGFGGVVVVVTPFCEMVCEFETGGIGAGVLEIYDYELFVCVLGE